MKTLTLLLLLFGYSTTASSQLLFTENTPLELTLNFDYTYVVKDRGERPLKYPALLEYRDENGKMQGIKLKVRTRGHSRKMESMCDFPPLMLLFDDDDVEDTPFEEQRKLKLVTHCKTGKKYRDLNLTEFLAYRIYNQLSDHSLRVRRVVITYKDFRGKDQTTQLGFFIEEEKQFRKRFDLKKVDDGDAEKYTATRDNLLRVALFNYLIGNTDWNLEERHNLELFRPDDTDQLLLVPYDFDLAGVVNAPYARPQTIYGIESVTDRYYLGGCYEPAEVKQAVAEFQKARPQIMKLIDDLQLRRKEEDRVRLFLKEFFDTLDAEEVPKVFMEKCA